MISPARWTVFVRPSSIVQVRLVTSRRRAVTHWHQGEVCVAGGPAMHLETSCGYARTQAGVADAVGVVARNGGVVGLAVAFMGAELMVTCCARTTVVGSGVVSGPVVGPQLVLITVTNASDPTTCLHSAMA